MAQEKLIDKVNDTPLRKIAYPLVIENLLFLAFSSIDVFMLSGYSDNAVAAVGLITQYTWFLLLLLQVIPNGATISLTNFLGAGQVEKAKKISRTALQMVIVFGLFFGLVFAFLIPQILKKYNKNSTAILHCFSGSIEFAKECIKEGIYIALGGVVTFKNAIKAKEVAAQIPIEYLLLETDDPYLAPVPFRGKENQPAYVKYVAEEIAKLRNTTADIIAQETTKNAERIFHFNAK